MRILDYNNNKKIDDVLILLNKSEILQLIEYLHELENANISEHVHLNNADCTKEITICYYEENNTSGFNDRIKKLIEDDK